MADEDPDRMQGVNMADIDDILADVTYPVTADELRDQHGQHPIERTNADPITLRELLEPVDEETFESPDDIHQMLLSLMPKESVGRVGYTDRGGSLPENTSDAEGTDEDDSV